MKKHSTVFIAGLLVLFAGCSMLGMKAEKSSQEAKGNVTIGFTLTRISGRASNQYAVWIEDEDGQLVRTLFVTDYMARKQGWMVREQTLITWQNIADVKNIPQKDIDAVSGATPQAGRQSIVWDMKDAAGKAVAAGTYVYRIEGSLLWENTEMWTGRIRVGGARESSRAKVSYFPDGADKMERTLISDVSAVCEPAP